MKLRIITKWLGTFLQEDSGKGSIKRILALLFCLVLMYVVVHYTRNVPNYQWDNLKGFAEVILAFVAVLLGLTYIPTRNQDKDQK